METQRKLWRNGFGFNIISNDPIENNENKNNSTEEKNDGLEYQLQEREIKTKLVKAQLELLKSDDYDAFIFIYSGYGYEKGIISSDDKKISFKTIKEYFIAEKIPNFKDKPKIYIIDACRFDGKNLPMYEDLVYRDENYVDK